MRSSMAALALMFVLTPAFAQNQLEPVDQEVVDQIRAEGLENSNVMNYVSWMTDVFGPRLTGSPALDAASDWAMETMEGMGLTNVHRDEWGPFGKGWTLKHFNIEAHSDYGTFDITAYPKAWSPGTDGHVEGQVVMVSAETEEDLEKYRGKLGDKVVMIQEIRELEEPFEAIAHRHTDSALLNMANASLSPPGQGGGGRRFNRGGNFAADGPQKPRSDGNATRSPR